jgi:gas vesicle protein
MLRVTRTGLKYLVIGLLAGLLFAPRSGRETRRMLRDEVVEYFNMIFRSAAGQIRRRNQEQEQS